MTPEQQIELARALKALAEAQLALRNRALNLRRYYDALGGAAALTDAGLGGAPDTAHITKDEVANVLYTFELIENALASGGATNLYQVVVAPVL